MALVGIFLTGCYGYRDISFSAATEYRIDGSRVIYDNGYYRDIFFNNGIYSYGDFYRWYGGDYYSPIFYNTRTYTINPRPYVKPRNSRTFRKPNRRNTRATRPNTNSRTIRSTTTRSRSNVRATVRRSTSNSGRTSTTKRN